jgi:glycosyltransferase involved in cell wall biosynthesis
MTMISVIMPAYNAAHLLPRVLPPLLKMLADGEVAELLVVDDQSTDNTADLAREMGAKVMITPANGGPGVARNLAAKEAIGDVLWFVDSDVIAMPGGPKLIARIFEDPQVGAAFGSYDNAPEGHWFSRYKNLLHRFHHQQAREASTFWAGCGAIRASTFAEVNGFDVETYRVPSIEDIELGYRITGLGQKIIVEPEWQGKHLKIWSIRNAIFTDIFRRALPWSRLMIAREGLTNELNAGTAERVRALIAGFFWLALLGALTGITSWAVWVAVALLALMANWRLATFFRENGGVLFAAGAMAYHQLYYVYSAAAYVWCLFEYHVLGKKDRLHVP